MKLEKYSVFLKTTESGSLSAAAEELGCTQSAVSHAISSLEEELGFTLLIRNKGGIKLTAEGEKMLPAIRNYSNSLELLRQTSAEIRGIRSGTVRIGSFTSVAVHWLPPVIKEFQKDYPDVSISLFNGDYHDVEEWLKDGSIDIGFVSLPIDLRCECTALVEDRLFAILPPEHKMASYPRFPLKECETEDFISLLKSSDHDARRALELAGVKPNVKYYTKDDYAIIAMVEQGLGISIMPELLLKNRHDRLAVLPLVPESRRTIGIAVADGSKTSPATLKFREYVVEYVKTI